MGDKQTDISSSTETVPSGVTSTAALLAHPGTRAWKEHPTPQHVWDAAIEWERQRIEEEIRLSWGSPEQMFADREILRIIRDAE